MDPNRFGQALETKLPMSYLLFWNLCLEASCSMMPKYRCGNGYGNQGYNLALLEILDTDKDMTVLIFSLEDF